MAFFVNFRYKFSFFALGAYKLKFSGYAYDTNGIQKEVWRLILICILKQNELQAYSLVITNLSRRIRKPTTCIGENKGADQLRSNCEADQRLCFRYSDSTVPLLLKSEISSF